jgi:predicted amidophosphoribosyltransferase
MRTADSSPVPIPASTQTLLLVHLLTRARADRSLGVGRAPLREARGMFLTTSCAGCGEPGVDLCRRCRLALAASAATVGDQGVPAAMPFDGVARRVLLGLKYANRRRVVGRLAALVVQRLGLHGAGIEVVTWAPTSRRRARARGFDQAELLARCVAWHLGVPCRRLLERRDVSASSQTGRSRADRLAAAPVVRGRPGVAGRRVLVVDDVVTSGATLLAARAALVAVGAEVAVAAVAATPDRAHAPPPRAA